MTFKILNSWKFLHPTVNFYSNNIIGDLGMKYGSSTKVANANWLNIQKERASMKAKNNKLHIITKAHSLKTPTYDFNTSCVIFCIGDPRVYETKLLSKYFNLVNFIAYWCVVKTNWSSKYACESHASGEPNAYFIVHSWIVSRWYVQVTITANQILHKLVPLRLEFANFNLKNCAWSRLWLVAQKHIQIGHCSKFANITRYRQSPKVLLNYWTSFMTTVFIPIVI